MSETEMRSDVFDSELRDDVLEELNWEPAVNPSEIGVAVTDGVITLSGVVDSYFEKVAAEQAAKRVFGVRAVANEIEVKLPGTAERTDTDIARAARDILDWSAIIPGGQVTVTVEDGWVKLEGTVDWQYQRREAESVVRNLTGVTGVSNQIVIREQPKSAEVQSKIENAIRRRAELDARHIRVETHGGRVVLHGSVRSWLEWREAEDAAWAAPGVTSVENRIVVTR